MQFLPCFLCGGKLEKRITKNDKPYFVCDPCGVQLFVRGKQGIERLDKLFRGIEKAKITFQQHAHNLYEIQATLMEIEGVKAEIEKSSGFFGSLLMSDEQFRARELLKTRLETLFQKLEELAKIRS